MADDKWSSLTFSTNNSKAVKGFLKDVDGCIKIVKQLAQLAQSNVAFLQLLLTGLANPFFIAVQVLCQAIEDYVNSLFNVGIYYMIIHSGNTDLEKVAKFKEDAEFKYPGQLLQDAMAIEDTSAAYEMLQMALRINSALPDSQKVRDAERERRPAYLGAQFLRPYEIAGANFVDYVNRKTSGKIDPAEQKNIKLRYIYNEIKDDVFIVTAFVLKYGSRAKAIIAEREGKSDLGNIVDDDDGNNDGVLGTTARASRYLMDSGLAYIGRKAEALGLTQLSPSDVLDAMKSALNDKGDFNRPGAPLFELHTAENKEERAEERIKNPQNYYFANSQRLQFEAILKNTAAVNKTAVEAKLKSVTESLKTIENDVETVYGEVGKPKRDKFGRPKLYGYNAGNTRGEPFADGNFGFFPSVPYEESLDAELDSGFTKYSGVIFYIGAPTIDGIPIEALELLGRVFNGFDKYFNDAIARVTMAFNEHARSRVIHLRNICQVVASKPPSAQSQSNPFFPKMKVEETFFKIEEGTILIGEKSKNTVIVIENQRTERENIVAVDDRGNVYNPYSTLTATMDKNKKVVGQDTQGAFNIREPGTDGSITFSEDADSSYSSQRLLVIPYTNSQGQGNYEPIEGPPFQPGELVDGAIEDGEGVIDINREVVGADIKSSVLGTFNTEMGQFTEYDFPPSIAPDFAPKLTVAEFFPDFAFAVRNTVLGFTQFLRGLAKGGSSAVGELVELLDEVIKFLRDLERGIVNFLRWLQSLAKLADAGIYAVTFSAHGKAELAAKFDKLKNADGAPPGHLKYSFAVLMLGAESDFGAFMNFLNTNQAFKNFEAAREKYGALFDQALKGFQEEIKGQLAESLRRGQHFQSTFLEDFLRNSDQSEDNLMLPGNQRDGLLTEIDFSAGGTDKFDNGGLGSQGSGGYLSETDAENALLAGQQGYRDANGNLTNNLLDASYFGFDSNQMRESADKLKFFWKFDVERLTTEEELGQRIIGYRLYWARSEQDEFENVSYERTSEIHSWLGKGVDFTAGIDTQIPLSVEVPVGTDSIPKGTSHVLLCSLAEVVDKRGEQTFYSLIESVVFHAIPISVQLPIEPEVIVDENISSVSLGEYFITRLKFTIEDKDDTGTDNTSTVLGYRIFFGDSNLVPLTTDPYMSVVLPADGSIVTVDLQNAELEASDYAGIETLLVYSENQNGLSPLVQYNLGKITAPRVGATGGNFSDVSPDRYSVSGDLKIDRGIGHISQFGIDDVYKVFFGQINPATNAVSVVGSQIGADVNYRSIDQNGQLTAPIPLTSLDKSTTHFMIFTARDKQNVLGQKVLRRESFSLPINDNGYFPRFAPEGLHFVDTDTVSDTVTGTFEITPATDESFIDNYTIYFGTEDFTRIDTTGRRSNAQGFIGAVTLGTSTVITMEEEEHGIKTGELITFTGVGGTIELNNNDYYASVDTANAQLVTLFSDVNLATDIDSSAFTAHTANTGIINHGVTPISDDDLGEISRPVTSVGVPQDAVYYMAFAKNGQGESKTFAYLPVVDPEYPPQSGEIISIEKNKPKVVDVT